MQRYRVIVLGPAILELKKIITYISTDINNSILAARIEQKIWDKINGLEFMPERNLITKDIYCVNVKPYIIYYKIRNNDVIIYAIRHHLQQRDAPPVLSPPV